MPWSISAVTWAIPVSVSQLIGHLEAHKKMKPTIDTLRLCNRFGKGPNAKITKLPIEMVKMIEQEILREPRATAARTWERRHACVEDRCEPLEHFGYFELKDFAQAIIPRSDRSDYDPDEQPSEPESDFDFGSEPDSNVESSHLKENLKLYLKGEFKCDCKVHEEFRKKLVAFASDELMDFPFHEYEDKQDWEEDLVGFFRGDLSKILKNELGVEAVIEQHALDTWFNAATICFLTLPSKAAKNEYISEYDIGARDFQCSVIDQDSLLSAQKHKKRLRNAMNVLSLDVCVHPSQFQEGIFSYRSADRPNPNAFMSCRCMEHEGVQSEEARIKHNNELSWPQLL